MSDALHDLFERGTPDPPATVRLDAQAAIKAGRAWARRRRTGALVAAVGAVASIAVLSANLLAPSASPERAVYAQGSPELGTVEAPVDVVGRPVASAEDRLGPLIEGPADLLARTETRKGTMVLFGQRHENGVCVSTAYLPPAVNMGSSRSCATADRSPARVLGPTPVVLSGFGPGGAPGGLKDPAITYGSAPPGTRRVVLDGEGRPPVTADARDGGTTYAHETFFVVAWDLGAGPTTARAYDAEGQLLGKHVFPFNPKQLIPDEQRCEIERSVMRGHFQRAFMVGEIYARTNPGAANPARFRPPRSGRANTPEGAAELFRRALPLLTEMAPEEKYEYRLAANVVLDQTKCFPSELRTLAADFKRASG